MTLSPTYLPYDGLRVRLEASTLGPGWRPPLEMEYLGRTFRRGEVVRDGEGELMGWRWWGDHGEVLFVDND